MKVKVSIANLSIFLFSLASLIISMKVFYNQAIFVDEHDLGMGAIFGGDLWLYLIWIRFLLLAAACAISFFNILKRAKRDQT